MDKIARSLIDFSAKVLYIVMTKHVSHDRAFQAALREYRKAARYVPLKVLYRVSHDIVSDYYLLRYAEQKIYGSRGSARRMAKLWLLLRGLESEHLVQHIESVERLRRRLVKSLPRRIENVEELVEGIEDTVKRLSVVYSFPRWFVEVFLEVLGRNETEKLLAALNEEKWWIRVNTLKADVDSVAERLLDKGVVVRRDPDLPYMLEVVDFNEPLHHLEEMWRGEIVFQDKASALVVEALHPEPGDTILDLAAAPGIKDALIMQLTENRARIIAVDVSWERLKRTKRLLRLYGVDTSRVEIIHADSRSLELRTKPDKIILDAPCTSSGAMGKDPAIKMHLEDLAWIRRFPALQREMLKKALTYKSSYIVYAVCSLLPFEGEEHISSMLGELEPLDPEIPGSPGYKPYNFRERVRRLLPHIHGTQGFFIAGLRPA
ncbi:ribosomal RNA small subunit methyltransferase B [Pyrodictium delaneyi]|uniref:Ribosomal RNA small subunit methyltransferase B n=1 Tax=Pyrodictium delaneyi TaxID=1273541 RepID=A0A0P0N5C8_9CREN|nr:RsmB/NOP family class I SAM-dependent RNA methyltransferase [Pyrodictium delaneyi]ALL01618.1 ribosomal RNA small subunit methyltransferase B [Pyrodictium delaneyi]